jgi:MFS family permease
VRTVSTATTTLRKDLVEGIRLLGPLPVMRLLLVTGVCFSMLEAFLHPIFIPFMQGTLHASATQVGFALSAQAIGTLACGVVVTAIAHRLGAARMFAIGAVGLSVATMVFALAPSYLVAVVALAALGVPSMLENVGTQTLLQTQVPDSLRGRALGLFSTTSGLARVVGAAVPAFAVGLLGVRGIVICAAGTTVAAAAIAVVGARLLPADDAAVAADEAAAPPVVLTPQPAEAGVA